MVPTAFFYQACHCSLNGRRTADEHHVARTRILGEYALKKLTAKNADVIFGNDVSDKTIGFNSDENEITVFTGKGDPVRLPRASKKDLGNAVVSFIADMLQ